MPGNQLSASRQCGGGLASKKLKIAIAEKESRAEHISQKKQRVKGKKCGQPKRADETIPSVEGNGQSTIGERKTL